MPLGTDTVYKVEIKDAMLEGSLVELIIEQYIYVPIHTCFSGATVTFLFWAPPL